MRRREDGEALLTWFNHVTGLPRQKWGDTVIGYGRYACTYASAQSGESFLTGFSQRKSALSLYVMTGYKDRTEPLSRLGKPKLGRSSLFLGKLAEIDMPAREGIFFALVRVKCGAITLGGKSEQ